MIASSPTRRASSALALLVVAGAPRLAWADGPSAADQALAQTLFDEGVKLMEEGKYAEACPKLAESQRLDPGGGTLLNLGLCREGEGKLASAWIAYNEALSQAIKDGRADREATARARLSGVAGRFARVHVDVDERTRALAGLTIALDGTELRAASWGTAVPIDTGEHALSAKAPGKKPWTLAFRVLRDGDSQRLSVPALEDAPVESPPPGQAGPGADGASHGSTQRVAGWITGGAGVVLLGVGTVFGIVAIDKRQQSNALCPDDRCSQAGVDRNEEAKAAAWVSNVTLLLGVAAVGTGVVLLLTAPKAPDKPAAARAVPRLVPIVGPGSFGLQGTF